ncbi:hypothetical protein [Euzebya tangerina]|uniref:hypothetical protein n=1 Tax=Euzebya tangerina TaxID=591198 RepID=UPI000E320435|nr:hypothetical protein [Euzebya tangerina]
MAYKLPNPERERTERRRELKRLRTKTDPGPERAERSAELAVIFHEHREINHVMELAQLVVEDVDDGVGVLLSAYLDGVEGVEDQMERLAMLANVGRWTELTDLEAAARDKGLDAAVRWTRSVDDEIEQAERLSVVERRFDEDLRKQVQQSL